MGSRVVWWRSRTTALGLAASVVFAAAGGCDGGSDTVPQGGAPPTDAGAGTGGSAGSAGDGGGGGTAGTGGSAGSGACSHQGQRGDSCGDDCDCGLDVPCRGLPGEQSCSIACEASDGCDGVSLNSCASVYCDLNIGACQCWCESASCSVGTCLGAYCVGCSEDDHCTYHSCGSTPGLDQPRCRLDTEQCVCGGTCGDGTCDEAEEAARSCPADCTGPCVDGEVLTYSCTDGTLVPWCTCAGSAWQCVDPTPSCSAPTVCAQQGGSCVDDPVNCIEGDTSGPANGCELPTPLCCLPNDCYGAGVTYAPMSGACCPGLRALTSAALMDSFFGSTPGVLCFANCWQLTCTPCGDGTCQLHFGENPCNCPEDCPQPPYPLVCEATSPESCGRSFCRQEATSCHQETPSCGGSNQCARDVQDLPGQICNPILGQCEPG